MSSSPDGAVLSGIDLLMNQSKKRAAGSDSVSVASSASVSSSAARRAAGSRPANAPSHFQPNGQFAPPDATVRPYAQQMPQRPPSPPPPPAPPPAPFFFNRRPQQQEEEDEEEEDDDEEEEEDEDEDEEEEEGDEEGSEASSSALARRQQRPMSPEEVANAKRDILYQFDRIERKGVRLPRRFTMADSLDDMRAELERVKIDREVDVSVRFQRKMLMTCVTGIELLNGKFDPFDIKLDGWSDSMHESVNDYDDVFEELHMKYRGKAKMAPELKLMFMVGGSGVMFHLTSSMFRTSSMPGMEEVMRQNPALRRQFAEATMNTMQQQQQPTPPRGGGGGGGGILGGLMSMFGGGGGGARPPSQMQQAYAPQQAQPPPQGQAQASATSSMRGPRQVDDILRDLHRGAFPPQPMSSSQRDTHRIEVVSNASESELGDLPEDALGDLGELSAAAAPPPPPARKRASGARRPK